MSADLPATTSLKVISAEAALSLFDLGLREGTRDGGEQAGDVVAHYRLAHLLGEGGFGKVWQAEQFEPIQRELALKIVKLGMNSLENVARFEAESRALAIMDHPNIASVLDAGTTPDDRPFLAMELVRGTPLTSYCDSRNLGIRERLELFIPVCLAVQHAHQKAILHRDLKPSNILVAEVDGKAVPKVIDFGISKVLATKATEQRTLAGALMGTLPYMSPEQSGSVADVDTRSDIYSLGVILYELLTGRTPLGSESPGYEETLRRIRLEEAVKPGNAVNEATALKRGSDLRRLRKLLHGDLDWITLRALEKDRRHRYQTATALAADLRRYLDNEPVSAAAPTWTYRFTKFARRQRAAFATAGLLSLTLIAGTAASLWQAAEAQRARTTAEENRALSQKNFNRARAAVEKYLTQVADHPRLKEADFHGLRKHLLETAIPFYEELAEYTGADPSLRYDKAQALGNLGDLYNELGDGLRAVNCFRAALEIDDGLLAEFPGRASYLEALGLHCNNLAPILGGDEGLSLLQRGLRALESLRHEFPDNAEYKQAWASATINLAVVMSRMGDHAGSEKALEEALAMLEQMSASGENTITFRIQLAVAQANVATATAATGEGRSEALFKSALDALEQAMKEFPDTPSTSGFFALAAHNFGHLLVERGRLEEAARIFERATEINRLAARRFPEIPSYRQSLGESLHALGNIEALRSHTAEAAQHFEEALSLFRRLHADHPRIPEYARFCAMSLDRLGEFRQIAGDWPAAAAIFSEAIALMREAVRGNPEHHHYPTELRHLLVKHATSCARQGKAAEAARSSLESCDYAGGDWETCEYHALQLAAITSMLESSHPELATECAVKATEMLQRAIDLGYPAMDSIQTDTRLTSLRRHGGFTALKPAPADPKGRSPSSFTFHYSYDDPGDRVWTRSGELWREKQPSGTINTYTTLERLRVFGISGTKLRRENEAGPILFIPDLGTRLPAHLMMLAEEGKWGTLGEIKDLAE